MSEESLRVAAVQLNSQDLISANLEVCFREVESAGAQGASLVVLPENFAFLGPETDKRRLAETLGDESAPIQKALKKMACDAGVTLVAGGFPERSPDPLRPFNSCLVLGPRGDRVAVYRKLHLFDVELPDGTQLLESEGVKSGSELEVFQLGGFTVGLSICYDLRFPELYRALVDRGAEVLLVPAAFTLQTGKDHWRVLLQARAIESQAWVVAANQWGRHPKGRSSFGHSMVVDPWGLVVAECSDRIGAAIVDIDRDYLERVRSSIPSLRHRRL